ncbi:hypothetical protein ACS0TY_019707 [Phlomoides rotata]
MAIAIAFLPFLLLIIPAAFAVDHTVGGNSGWTSGVVYTDWTSGLTFTTGDTLVFTYDATHQVDEVSAADYRSCNTANPINTDSSSPTTISLTTAGTRYFICPRSNHCAQGMKLAVTVTAGTTSPSPSPPSGTTPSPPSGGATPSPPSQTPRTPTTNRSPPPPASAAATLGGRSNFIVGSFFVFVAGLMMG